MLTITSRENKLIKHMAKLSQNRRYRYSSGEFVTEGDKLSWEAAQSLGKPLQLLVTQQALNKGGAALEFLMDKMQEQAVLIPEEISEKLTAAQTPQGVFCLWQMPENMPKMQDISKGKYLVLDGLQDPGNVGTIIRSCEAFGLDGVILSASCPDLYSPKVLRSTMGGIFRLPVYVCDNLVQAVLQLREKGFQVYATALSEDSRDITQIEWSDKAAVVIGNEGNGVSREILESCEQPSVIIKMNGNAESLNAGVASAIVAWEMVR